MPSQVCLNPPGVMEAHLRGINGRRIVWSWDVEPPLIRLEDLGVEVQRLGRPRRSVAEPEAKLWLGKWIWKWGHPSQADQSH